MVFDIQSLPYFLSQEEAPDWIRMYSELVPGGVICDDSLPEPLLDKLATKACRGSMRGGDTISRDEAETLLRDLALCKVPTRCPHGRPVFTSISRTGMEALFKR